MKNYFDKFTDLKPIGDLELEVVPTGKLTAFLSYQQPHFNLITDPQELIVYRKLSQRIQRLESKIERNEERYEKIISRHPEVKALTERCYDLHYELIRGRFQGFEEDQKNDEFEQIKKDLRKLRREVYSEDVLERARAELLPLYDQVDPLSLIRGEIPATTICESPTDSLLVYGVFDYKGEPIDHPLEEQEIEPCFQFLQERLLEDLKGHHNDEIKRIVIDTGRYDWLYEIGEEIQEERGLPPGIVQIYSSYNLYSDTELPTHVKNRKQVCNEIKKWGLPKEVVEVFMWPEAPLMDILKGSI